MDDTHVHSDSTSAIEQGRTILRTTDGEIFARVSAVFAENTDERPVLPVMPCGMLHRVKELIWKAYDGAQWDGSEAGNLVLLAHVIADYMGMDAPEHPPYAGQAMFRDWNAWVDEENRKWVSIRVKQSRAKRRRAADAAGSGAAADGAAGANSADNGTATGGGADATLLPDDIEALHLRPYDVCKVLESAHAQGRQPRKRDRRRTKGAAAAAVASEPTVANLTAEFGRLREALETAQEQPTVREERLQAAEARATAAEVSAVAAVQRADAKGAAAEAAADERATGAEDAAKNMYKRQLDDMKAELERAKAAIERAKAARDDAKAAKATSAKQVTSLNAKLLERGAQITQLHADFGREKDALDARVASLESENAALKAELLDAQQQLARGVGRREAADRVETAEAARREAEKERAAAEQRAKEVAHELRLARRAGDAARGKLDELREEIAKERKAAADMGARTRTRGAPREPPLLPTCGASAFTGMLLVSLDALHLDDGWLAAAKASVPQTDVLTAPEPTALKEYHRVRVAFDNEHVGGQVWQYGIIRYVHTQQLIDINLDGGEEVRCIPSLEVQRA